MPEPGIGLKPDFKFVPTPVTSSTDFSFSGFLDGVSDFFESGLETASTITSGVFDFRRAQAERDRERAVADATFSRMFQDDFGEKPSLFSGSGVEKFGLILVLLALLLIVWQSFTKKR